MRTVYYLILLLSISLNTLAQSVTQKKRLNIPDGMVGLIGYGSLTSKKSMESTLGRAYTDIFEVVHIDSFERIWNFAHPNDGSYRSLTYLIVDNDTIYPKQIVYLNIQPAPQKLLNACLFIIKESELKAFDDREVGYTRINVSKMIKEFEVMNGSVYAYIGLPEFTIRTEDDIRQNVILYGYVKVVEESFTNFGEQFRNEYLNSTIPPPQNIVRTVKRKSSK